MIGIEKPKIETEGITPDGTYGKFIVEPLERGYGTTLGNSLRRVLLSSLPGYAIISVKIDGILHEFSTIPGVKEDVTEIVLNLKDVILKIHGDGPKTVYIDASGECEITAGSIQTDSAQDVRYCCIFQWFWLRKCSVIHFLSKPWILTENMQQLSR